MAYFSTSIYVSEFDNVKDVIPVGGIEYGLHKLKPTRLLFLICKTYLQVYVL
jgi:hypothetical protein